jgi:hypothetical protein
MLLSAYSWVLRGARIQNGLPRTYPYKDGPACFEGQIFRWLGHTLDVT